MAKTDDIAFKAMKNVSKDKEIFKPKLDLEWKQDEYKYMTDRYQGSPEDIADRMRKDELFSSLMNKYHGASLNTGPDSKRNPISWESRAEFPAWKKK